MKRFLKYTFGLIVLVILFGIIFFWKNDIPLENLKLKYAQAPSQFVEVNGSQLHYRDQGLFTDTLPIVLIHGTGSSLHTWEGWVSDLQKTRRVITLDLPGYGLTGPDKNSDYSYGNYNKYLNEFFKKLKLNRFVLGGNSLGGTVSWHYASQYSYQVKALILVDAGGYYIKPKSVPIAFKMAKIPVINNLLKFITPRFIVQKSIENVFSDDSKISDKLIDRYYELSLRPGNRQAFINRMTFPTKIDLNVSLQISKLTMPTLVLWGAEDQLITTESAQKFHTDLPNDTLVILDKLGHVPMEEDPVRTLEVVKGFLKII